MQPRHDPRLSDLRRSIPSVPPRRPSRRAFMAGAAAAGALAAWVPVFRVSPASAQATTSPPPNFPSSISIYQQAYQNWAGMIVIDDVWTCAPASADDVVTLANWAYANGYRLRAKGMCHGWSPLLLPSGSTGAGYVLLDTTQNLTSVSISGVDITTRTSTSTYDALGEFALTNTNALGQSESWQYDARFGKPTSHTGPNGLTTTWSYDVYGRKTLEVEVLKEALSVARGKKPTWQLPSPPPGASR